MNQVDTQICCNVLAGALLDVFGSMALDDLKCIDWLTYETELFVEQRYIAERQAA